MGIVDVIILLFLALGAVIGLKRGFFTQTVSFAGLLVVLIISFLLKDLVADILLNVLPFFSFGPFGDAQILNILLYQFIGFIIIFSILSGILHLVLFVTKVFEKVLTLTIILGIPSKILGAIVGLLEAYLIAFIAVLILNQPMFNLTMVHESGVGEFILNKTPIISNMSEGLVQTIDEIYDLTKYYEDGNTDEFNTKGLDIMLKNKIVKKDTVESLIKQKKLTFNGVNEVLEKYE